MDVVWFKGIREIRKHIRAGEEYVLFGKPARFNNTLQMAHPEVDSPVVLSSGASVRSVYPLTERLRQRNIDSRVIHGAIITLLSSLKRPLLETLPESVVRSNGLLNLDSAIRTVHVPADAQSLKAARHRLKFEELFYIQTDIELTGAQKRVIKEIHADMARGRQMNRLVQGDVGSGKTLVALMAMLLAIDNGYQACLMAPTEILAGQHFATISGLASKIGLNIRLLTGSTKAKERREIDRELRDGTLHILVGAPSACSRYDCYPYPTHFSHDSLWRSRCLRHR